MAFCREYGYAFALLLLPGGGGGGGVCGGGRGDKGDEGDEGVDDDDKDEQEIVESRKLFVGEARSCESLVGDDVQDENARDVGLQGRDIDGEAEIVLRSDKEEAEEFERRLRVDTGLAVVVCVVAELSSTFLLLFLFLFLCLFLWDFNQIQMPSSLCLRPSVPKIWSRKDGLL